MKKIRTLALVVCIANSFWSCEKDDICAEGTPTTPNLIVEFYDKDNRSTLKPVTDLKIFIPEGDTLPFNGSVTKIKVPLLTNADITKWGFVLSNATTSGPPVLNVDFLEFHYIRNEIYVSRACGYKTFFYFNEENPEPILTDNVPPDNLWIQDMSVEKTNIEDENETHIKIYF